MVGLLHKRDRRSRGATFGAPWGRVVKLATGATVLIIVTAIVVPQLALASRPAPLWVRILVPGLLVSIFGVAALFSVRGFTVKGRELWVQRTFWQTRLSLENLKSAHVDSKAMEGSFRMAGNGGFLAITGWFRSRKLKNYRAFVTDPGRAVVLEFRDRRIVVSPDDPSGFVRALGFEPGTDTTRKPR